jgi:putative nucleotidyltransferase with HDIG domain
LVNFMVNPTGEGDPVTQMPPVEVLETLGLERARSLAITFFTLNYESPKSTTFDWTPLWRHQITVGVVMDFIYDALDLKRSGLEYAAGAFHDIGKMILAELFPFAYFTAMNRSMHEELPLVICEMEMFGMNHAEVGAAWLKEQEFPAHLVDAIAQHETPARINRRALLAHALVSSNHLVKQIGIGYSGNSMLDPRPWEQLPSTGMIWDARGNKDYVFDDFAHDILSQFESFPDLL